MRFSSLEAVHKIKDNQWRAYDVQCILVNTDKRIYRLWNATPTILTKIAFHWTIETALHKIIFRSVRICKVSWFDQKTKFTTVALILIILFQWNLWFHFYRFCKYPEEVSCVSLINSLYTTLYFLYHANIKAAYVEELWCFCGIKEGAKFFTAVIINALVRRQPVNHKEAIFR